jgi:preprotein translocase subunit SecD
MGRKDIIRSLIVSISLVSYHKILYEKGKKSEGKKHLEDEIRDYSTDGFEKALESNLRRDELKEVESKAVKRALSVLRRKYPDLKVSEPEVKEKVIDTMQEFLLI